jgi:hypothetical protein
MRSIRRLRAHVLHHLVEPEEVVEVLAFVRTLASLKGLSIRLPEIDSAGSAEVLLVFR